MEQTKIVSFGANPSKHDYRTVTSDIATPEQAALPPIQAKVALDYPSVNQLCDQQALGICSECGTRMGVEEYFHDGVRLSEYWGYLIAKVLLENNLIEGSSAFTMLKAANKYGIPTKAIESKYPLHTTGTYQQFIDHFRTTYGGKIPEQVLADATKHKIGGYYKVSVDPISIAREIASGRLVIARVACGETFWTAADGRRSWAAQDILPIRAPKNVVSGHLMAMNEYRGLGPDQLQKGPNSWSDAWGDKGYWSWIFNVQAPYYFTEAWAIQDLPPHIIQRVQDLPEAKNFKHSFTKNIQRADTGTEVRALQIALSILGFLNVQVDELGTFGPKTSTAVLAYQKARKLLPDEQLQASGGNYVYHLTLDALNKDFNQ